MRVVQPAIDHEPRHRIGEALRRARIDHFDRGMHGRHRRQNVVHAHRAYRAAAGDFAITKATSGSTTRLLEAIVGTWSPDLNTRWANMVPGKGPSAFSAFWARRLVQPIFQPHCSQPSAAVTACMQTEGAVHRGRRGFRQFRQMDFAAACFGEGGDDGVVAHPNCLKRPVDAYFHTRHCR